MMKKRIILGIMMIVFPAFANASLLYDGKDYTVKCVGELSALVTVNIPRAVCEPGKSLFVEVKIESRPAIQFPQGGKIRIELIKEKRVLGFHELTPNDFFFGNRKGFKFHASIMFENPKTGGDVKRGDFKIIRVFLIKP